MIGFSSICFGRSLVKKGFLYNVSILQPKRWNGVTVNKKLSDVDYSCFDQKKPAVREETFKRETSKPDSEIHSESSFNSLSATEIECWPTVLLVAVLVLTSENLCQSNPNYELKVDVCVFGWAELY